MGAEEEGCGFCSHSRSIVISSLLYVLGTKPRVVPCETVLLARSVHRGGEKALKIELESGRGLRLLPIFLRTGCNQESRRGIKDIQYIPTGLSLNYNLENTFLVDPKKNVEVHLFSLIVQQLYAPCTLRSARSISVKKYFSYRLFAPKPVEILVVVMSPHHIATLA